MLFDLLDEFAVDAVLYLDQTAEVAHANVCPDGEQHLAKTSTLLLDLIYNLNVLVRLGQGQLLHHLLEEADVHRRHQHHLETADVRDAVVR